MSFKKKLSIAIAVSTLLSNCFANASEDMYDLNSIGNQNHFESDQISQISKISQNVVGLGSSDSNDDNVRYFITNTSESKESKMDIEKMDIEKMNIEKSVNKIFGIKNDPMLKLFNDDQHNNANISGIHPTKIVNNNKINSSPLDLQNIFGLNKKCLNDLNNIENKSDKLDSHKIKKNDAKIESKFSGLLKGLNLSNKQIALSEKIKFGQLSNVRGKYNTWRDCKKIKVYFLIYLYSGSKEVKTKVYYYNVPKQLENNVNEFTENEKNMKKIEDHLKKITANGVNSDSRFTNFLDFSETLTFRMVIGDPQNGSANFFTLKNRGEKHYHELDYSKYSENDLVDLCKYFVYCIPDAIIPDSVLE